MKIEIGQPAIDFTLNDQDKNPVTLSAQQGSKVVLLFFPKAFTSVCTRELCSVRDHLADYNNANAKVFGISCDTPEDLNAYKAEQQLNFSLLSDHSREISFQYGSLYQSAPDDRTGVSKRSAFVIDEKGIVIHAEVLEDAYQIPDFDAIHHCLKSN